MLQLGSRNVSAIVSQYEGNATVIWTGNTLGIGGTYIGTKNIGLALSAFLGAVSSFIIGNETQTIATASDDSVVVNSSFSFAGESADFFGPFNGTVSAQDSYTHSAASGAWLISRETWDFLSFNVRNPSIETVGGPSPIQKVDALSISADGSYLAAGTTDSGGDNGRSTLSPFRSRRKASSGGTAPMALPSLPSPSRATALT
jgi:hypothetical protein